MGEAVWYRVQRVAAGFILIAISPFLLGLMVAVRLDFGRSCDLSWASGGPARGCVPDPQAADHALGSRHRRSASDVSQ